MGTCQNFQKVEEIITWCEINFEDHDSYSSSAKTDEHHWLGPLGENFSVHDRRVPQENSWMTKVHGFIFIKLMLKSSLLLDLKRHIISQNKKRLSYNFV